MPSIIWRENDDGEVEYLSSISPALARNLALKWSSKSEHARRFTSRPALAKIMDRLGREDIDFEVESI